MSSIMRRRRGLKSAISILLSEGGGLQHPHPLSQEAIYATSPLTPRQRLRSIPNRFNLTPSRFRPGISLAPRRTGSSASADDNGNGDDIAEAAPHYPSGFRI